MNIFEYISGTVVSEVLKGMNLKPEVAYDKRAISFRINVKTGSEKKGQGQWGVSKHSRSTPN